MVFLCMAFVWYDTWPFAISSFIMPQPTMWLVTYNIMELHHILFPGTTMYRLVNFLDHIWAECSRMPTLSPFVMQTCLTLKPTSPYRWHPRISFSESLLYIIAKTCCTWIIVVSFLHVMYRLHLQAKRASVLLLILTKGTYEPVSASFEIKPG